MSKWLDKFITNEIKGIKIQASINSGTYVKLNIPVLYDILGKVIVDDLYPDISAVEGRILYVSDIEKDTNSALIKTIEGEEIGWVCKDRNREFWIYSNPFTVECYIN